MDTKTGAMPSGDLVRYFRGRTIMGRVIPGQWHAAMGDIEVVRKTKREAHDALMAALWQIVSGSYEPIYMEYADYRALVYRSPNGWHYRIGPDCDDPDDRPVEISCGSNTRDQAIRAARLHLAQNAYPWGNGLDLFTGENSGGALKDDPEAMQEHARWLSWQRACEAEQERLRDMGEEDPHDMKAHAYACRNADAYGSWLTATERAISGL